MFEFSSLASGIWTGNLWLSWFTFFELNEQPIRAQDCEELSCLRSTFNFKLNVFMYRVWSGSSSWFYFGSCSKVGKIFTSVNLFTWKSHKSLDWYFSLSLLLFCFSICSPFLFWLRSHVQWSDCTPLSCCSYLRYFQLVFWCRDHQWLFLWLRKQRRPSENGDVIFQKNSVNSVNTAF